MCFKSLGTAPPGAPARGPYENTGAVAGPWEGPVPPYLRGVFTVFEKCLKNVRKVFEKCLKIIRIVFEKY